ncbi:MAG: type II secretion system F family protein [Pirellulales bacterium]|nr:type II secretion system F family protein [Pirellulales bacterium]
MPDFAYTARNAQGQEVAGTISAATQREALVLLGDRALFPLRLVQEKTSRLAALQKPKKVKQQALAATLAQMADLMKSGVPLMRSLEILARQSSNPLLTEVMGDVRTQVSEGSTLDAAFARHPQVFNELTVSMVRAGGEGGFLEDVLQRTADFIEQQEELKSRVVGALTYPALLAIAGSSAVTVLIVFFVPKFAELFARLEERGELPFMTTALLGTSDFIGRYGLLLVALAIGVVLWIRQQLKTEKGRLVRDRLKIKVPVAGPIFLNLAVSRFCRVLGTLLHNGVPILKSLEISSDSTGNRVMAQAIQQAGENISSGQTLAGPLASCGLFPQTVVEMISVAEESNNLENVLVNIADGLDRRTSRQLDLMVRLIEPAMLLVMASVILCVVIALLLPVFQMSATIG